MAVILAIESSCDDTSAAVIRDGVLLSNITDIQQVHAQYGGIVPEAASRQHEKNIVAVVDAAIQAAGVSKTDIEAVAFTRGPGLIGSLMVGVSFAKGFALAHHLPLIAVHHMQAHILAHFIESPVPPFPFLCLTVSGGHTQIVRVTDYLQMEIIGETLDDAAGEAFDKIGKLLGLSYPAGPKVDQLAKSGNPHRFSFPEPKIPGLNYSFSGIKTAVLYFLQEQQQGNPSFIDDNLEDLCAAVQHRIVTVLLSKLRRASRETGIQHIAIAGGVSANSGLRKMLAHYANKDGWTTYIPRMEYCTDNAGMVAMAAHYQYLAGDFVSQEVTPLARVGF